MEPGGLALSIPDRPSIPHVFHDHLAVFLETDPLHHEQPPFHILAALMNDNHNSSEIGGVHESSK
jgi:hypothetical protein